jgi:hypothetical protein
VSAAPLVLDEGSDALDIDVAAGGARSVDVAVDTSDHLTSVAAVVVGLRDGPGRVRKPKDVAVGRFEG